MLRRRFLSGLAISAGFLASKNLLAGTQVPISESYTIAPADWTAFCHSWQR